MTETSELPRAEVTRQRLLDAAVTAFAEKGFHGTTTRDIAAAAGLSPAAVYVHHRTKEELLYQISRAGHQETLELVQAALATSDDPVAALRAAVHDFAVNHARETTVARIVNYELRALSPQHLREIRAIRHQIDEAVRSVVERGVAAGVFDVVDARITTTALLSLGIDIARWYRDGLGWSPDEVGNHYADMALRIVGAAGGDLMAPPRAVRSRTRSSHRV